MGSDWKVRGNSVHQKNGCKFSNVKTTNKENEKRMKNEDMQVKNYTSRWFLRYFLKEWITCLTRAQEWSSKL